MAIGTLTMILANVGLSVFNSWANGRNSDAIRKKQEEFTRASADGNRERMMRLLHEGQQLTLDLENKKHEQRLKDLNDQFDNLIFQLASARALDEWPLKTLPIVMKNQAIGNLLSNREERVALHCIFTPSNCAEFNTYVMPKVESELEAYCNLHWSNLSVTSNPILFYSGAWTSNSSPTDNHVKSMKAALSDLPTLVIYPCFRPTDKKLTFQVYTWGIGSDNGEEFTIPEIDPYVKPKSVGLDSKNEDGNEKIRFQNEYRSDLNWLEVPNLIAEAVEDLVPYLECLIGYIADTYFWSAFGSVPQLPRMLTDGTINTDGMKYLVDDTRDNFSQLLDKCETIRNPSKDNLLLRLVEGAESLWSESNKCDNLNRLFDLYSRDNKFFDGKQYVFDISDLGFINECLRISNHWKDRLMTIKSQIIKNEPSRYNRRDFPDSLKDSESVDELDFLIVIKDFKQYCASTHLLNTSLLIEQDSPNSYSFSTYDYESDTITYYPLPFNRKYNVGAIKNCKNINHIFSNGRVKEISCSLERLHVLESRISNKDLTY